MTRLSGQWVGSAVVGVHYRLEAPLGAGGFGTVHRAIDVRIQRPVAVKLLRRELMGSGDVEARFMREAELARRLEHPNTVRLLDFGRAEDGTPFLVYELLAGESLGDALARYGGMPVDRVVHIGTQLLKSISEAHGLGIVHRDIKPANIFLTNFAGSPDFVKVLDFGIAKAPSDQMTVLTQTGVTVGTPSYMSPEQVRSEGVGPATDLYAIGLVLGEALTGRVVVWCQTPLLTAMEQIADRPVPLSPEVTSSPIGQVLQRATQKNLAHRYASAHEMLAALEAAARGTVAHPSPMAQAPTAPAAPYAPPRMHPAMAPVPLTPAPLQSGSGRGALAAFLLVFGLVALGAAGAALFALTRSDEKHAGDDGDDKPRKTTDEPAPSATTPVVEPAPIVEAKHDELHRRIEKAGFKVTSHRMEGGQPVVSNCTAERGATTASIIVSNMGSAEAAQQELARYLADDSFVGAVLRDGSHVLVIRATERPSGADSPGVPNELVKAIALRDPDLVRDAVGAPAKTAAPSTPVAPTAVASSPPPPGGVPAKCADICKRQGHCSVSGDRCVVGSDADCRGSERCSGFGNCFKLGDACAAKSEADCRNASRCRTSGVCSLEASISVCLAKNKADCEASTRCQTDGACSVGSGSCVALTEAECKASQRCKTEGICSLAGNTCVKKN